MRMSMINNDVSFRNPMSCNYKLRPSVSVMEVFATLVVALNIATLYTGTIFNSFYGLNYNLILAPLVLAVSLVWLMFRGVVVPSVDGLLFCLYALCIFPSVLISKEIENSVIAYLVFMTYWVVAIYPLYFFKNNIAFILYSSIIFGFVSVLYVTYNSLVGMEELLRLQVIGDVDTNHLSLGLGLLVILTLRMVAYTRRCMARVGLSLMVISLLVPIFLLMSRTVILGLFVGCVLAIFVSVLTHANGKLFFKSLLFVLFAAVVSWVTFDYFFPDSMSYLTARFTASQYYDVRLLLWRESLSEINDWQDILFGVGYFQTNPHNEFVRYFTNSGIIGFFWITSFLLLTYLFKVWALRNDRLAFLFQNWLFLYMIIYLSTYGHVKTFWIAPAGIVMNYLLTKYSRERVNYPETVATPYVGNRRS